MVSSIVQETEILIKYMGSFISPCTANYIDDLLKKLSFVLRGCRRCNP